MLSFGLSPCLSRHPVSRMANEVDLGMGREQSASVVALSAQTV